MEQASTSQFKPSSATASTALSLRVSKLLATSNFEDPNTRAALKILNRFGRNEESTSDGSSLTTDLHHLKKGGLRRVVEDRIRLRSKEFLDLFAELNNELNDLKSHIDHMQECCDETQEKLIAANEGTKYLLEHADGLRKASQSTANKQLLAKVFLHRFTLTELEIQALTTRDVKVNRHLFSAMDHCERIRSDCAALLTGDLTPAETETAGLDIMQAISKYLDKGYEKVMKWTLFECRTGLSKGEEGQLEVSSLMKKAINRLNCRPELLDEALLVLSATRSAALSSLFLDALTRGGPNGLPRPIELNAHDPIRYVGDMLAWVHQTMASEHEFLESLFDLKSDGRRVGESRIFSPKFSDSTSHLDLQTITSATESVHPNEKSSEDRKRVRNLLDKHMEGCGRPLKIRVYQTIKSQEGSIVAYQLASLLEFYKVTMTNTIGPDALLTKTLTEITTDAYEIFFQILTSLSSRHMRYIEQPPVDLSVPTALNEAMSNLRDIMSIYNDNSAEEMDVNSFDRVLELTIGPALELITKMAALRVSNWDQSIFWINCLEFMISTLTPFKFTEEKKEELEVELKKHLKILTEEHFDQLLKSSGLQPIIQALDTKEEDVSDFLKRIL
ncbi:oligomeric Golgi complex subunit 6 [Melampsora americana]|nr:oligomeric Golgi complex subunit 6 [Melampsora americana]